MRCSWQGYIRRAGGWVGKVGTRGVGTEDSGLTINPGCLLGQAIRAVQSPSTGVEQRQHPALENGRSL